MLFLGSSLMNYYYYDVFFQGDSGGPLVKERDDKRYELIGENHTALFLPLS